MKRIIILLCIAICHLGHSQSFPKGNWTNLGPSGKSLGFTGNIQSGVAQVIALDFHHTDPNTLYAGTYGGVYKSVDDGQNWTQLNTKKQLGASSEVNNLVTFRNPQKLVISTGVPFGHAPHTYTNGIFRTEDGGNSWSNISSGLPDVHLSRDPNQKIFKGYQILRLYTCPFDTNKLFACTELGLFMTSNLQSATPTWQQINLPNGETYVRNIVIKPGSIPANYTYYVSGNEFLYKSTNLTTWTSMIGAGTGLDVYNDPFFSTQLGAAVNAAHFQIDVTPADPSLVFAKIIVNKTKTMIYKFNGTQWLRHLPGSLNNEYHSDMIVADRLRTDRVYIGGMYLYAIQLSGGIVKSFRIEGYTTEWCNQSHADIKCIAISPHNFKTYAGNDGFLSKLDDTKIETSYYDCTSGIWFPMQNNGLNAALVWDIDVSSTDPDHLIAGFQDNGSARYYHGTWTNLGGYLGGDGGTPLVFSDNIGFTNVNSSTTHRWNFTTQARIQTTVNVGGGKIVLKKGLNNPSSIYAVGFDFWTCNDDATGFINKVRISDFQNELSKGPTLLQDFHVRRGANNNDILYAMYWPSYSSSGPDKSWIVRSLTGGNINGLTNQWERIPLPTGVSEVRTFTVSDSDPNAIYIVPMYCPQYSRVMVTYNAGQTWSNLHQLNDIPFEYEIIDLEFVPNSKGALFAGTRSGVYYSDEETPWYRFDNGMANSPVTSIRIVPETQKVYAATWGTGVWVSPLYCKSKTVNVTQGPDITICPDGAGTITASGSANYSWYPATGLSSTTVANPIAKPIENTTYVVTGKDNFGCEDNASVNVVVRSICNSPVFDGVNDQCTVPANSAYNLGAGAFTVEATVRFATSVPAGSPMILSHRNSTSAPYDGFFFAVQMGNKLMLQINGINHFSTVSFPSLYDNQCHHLAVTRNASGVGTFYLDGASKGTFTTSASINSPGNMRIGNDFINPYPMKGSINEVRFWNVEKTNAEIQANKTTTYNTATANLIGLWRFKQYLTQNVCDESATRNDGYYGTTTNAGDADPALTGVVCNPFLRTPENPGSVTAGVNYKYYVGNWDALPDFSTIPVVSVGTWSNVSTNIPHSPDYFAVLYSGYIHVPADGIYTFYTTSDDGSQLYIGNVQVVNNDGLHPMQEQSGMIGLKAGTHAFSVRFFEKAGGEGVEVRYQGPTLSKQIIPSTAYYRTAISVRETNIEPTFSENVKVVFIHPNPFETTLKVLVQEEKTSSVNLALLNTQGKIVYENTIESNKGHTIELTIPSGLYTVVLTYSDGSIRQYKVIKMQ